MDFPHYMSIVPVSESNICHSHDGHEHDMMDGAPDCSGLADGAGCPHHDHTDYVCYSGYCVSPYCAPATAPVDGTIEVGDGFDWVHFTIQLNLTTHSRGNHGRNRPGFKHV